MPIQDVGRWSTCWQHGRFPLTISIWAGAIWAGAIWRAAIWGAAIWGAETLPRLWAGVRALQLASQGAGEEEVGACRHGNMKFNWQQCTWFV
jgi:hypothetical protein